MIEMGQDTRMFGIHWNDYEKFGCPFCGSDYAFSNVRCGNEVPATCGECKKAFVLLPDELDVSSMGFYDKNNELYHVEAVEHPRMGIPKHKFHAPDVRPSEGGEYWRPRGIGYDLSGFVKSKEAGERIVQMFEKALGRKPNTWLDYRPSEPTWIQVKVAKEDADLDKLYALTQETGVITQEIINSVVIV